LLTDKERFIGNSQNLHAAQNPPARRQVTTIDLPPSCFYSAACRDHEAKTACLRERHLCVRDYGTPPSNGHCPRLAEIRGHARVGRTYNRVARTLGATAFNDTTRVTSRATYRATRLARLAGIRGHGGAFTRAAAGTRDDAKLPHRSVAQDPTKGYPPSYRQID